MQLYDDSEYDPPAPLAFVNVRSAAAGITISGIPMLLDTGADVSLVPRKPIIQLMDGVGDLNSFELEAFDGAKSNAPALQLEIEFLGKVFRGQFLVVDAPHGVLGRNVLNCLAILFDGPKLQWGEVP